MRISTKFPRTTSMAWVWKLRTIEWNYSERRWHTRCNLHANHHIRYDDANDVHCHWTSGGENHAKLIILFLLWQSIWLNAGFASVSKLICARMVFGVQRHFTFTGWMIIIILSVQRVCVPSHVITGQTCIDSDELLVVVLVLPCAFFFPLSVTSSLCFSTRRWPHSNISLQL